MKGNALVRERKKQNTETDSSDGDIDTSDSVRNLLVTLKNEVIESTVDSTFISVGKIQCK